MSGDFEVRVQNVVTALRPDGGPAVRVDLTFKHPVKPTKKPQEFQIPVAPGMPPSELQEIKALIIFMEDEWGIVKDKYQVGNLIKMSIDDKKRVIFE